MAKRQRQPRYRRPDTTKVKRYEDTSNIGVGSFVPNFQYSRSRMLATAWDAYNTFIGNQYLDFTTQLAAYLTEYAGPFQGALDPANLKDIDTTQQTHYQESVFYGADLLHNMGSQSFLRNANKLLTESDASGYWTQETWDAFCAGLENRQLYVPVASVNLALSFNVGWVLQMPYPRTNLPLALYYRWKTADTITNARTNRDAIVTRQAGARIHAAKFGLPMVPLTSNLVKSCFRLIPYGCDEWIFHYINGLLRVDVGGGETEHCFCSPTGVQFEANKVASWTSHIMVWRGDRPHDLWAFAPISGNVYEAVNNVPGTLTFGTVANDSISILASAQDDTVLSELSTAQVNMAYPMNGGTMGASQFVGGGLADAFDQRNMPQFYNDPNTFYHTGITYDQFEDMRRVLFQYMLKNLYPFGKSEVKGETPVRRVSDEGNKGA